MFAVTRSGNSVHAEMSAARRFGSGSTAADVVSEIEISGHGLRTARSAAAHAYRMAPQPAARF